MKILQAKTKIDRTGSLECRRATISLNPATLHILSRDLYKYPIKSMIREIFINGVDSHWEAKQTIPIDIKIPSIYDTEFYIRDYGTGIPHQLFMDIYLDYGSSTKREDNEMHGGFGLGTKSPLAYTECFFVTSFIDNIKNSYLVYYDEDNTPCVDHIQSEFTTEPNGLKVALTAHTSYDYLEFRRACIAILRRIPSHIYNIVNRADLSIKEDELIPLSGKTYGPIMIYPGKGIEIIMGYVAYELDRYAALEYAESHVMYIDTGSELINFYHILNNLSSSFAIEVNSTIGTYSVHPSKEHVNITPKTIALLQEDIQRAITALYKEANEPEFITDIFKFKISNILENDRKDIPIKARIIKRSSCNMEISLANTEKYTYLEIIQETYLLSGNLYVVFLNEVDYADYVGKSRKVFIVPDICPRDGALLIIEDSGEVENLRDIFINLHEIDLSSDIEEYKALLKENRTKIRARNIRNAVRSMQEPTHNILLLKVANDKNRIGNFKCDWNSAKHNVKTLKELKRPIFWTATRYGCLENYLDNKDILEKLAAIYDSLPKWKKPIIIGLPATKGTKFIERAFSPLSDLESWLDKFVQSDYYKRRANIYLASYKNTLIRIESLSIDRECLAFGPYNWLVRLQAISYKYGLFHYINGNASSIIVRKADDYYAEIALKLPWVIPYNYRLNDNGLPKNLNLWIKEIINFTNQKPTGAKAKNDARYLSW